MFEQMLATINMSLPSEAMKHAAKVPGSDGKIFEVLYDNEQSSAVTAVWGEKFPATAVHLKIDDSESGCKMVLHPEKHVDSMYQDCLPYELGKNVYQYALACYHWCQ